MADTTIWDVGSTEVPIPGPQGPVGPAPELSIGSVTSGTSPAVTITEISEGKYSLSWVIPAGVRGPRGLVGEAAKFASVVDVTTLAAGESATASITGSGPTYTLNLGIPRGAQGDPGPSGDATVIHATMAEPDAELGLPGDWALALNYPVTLWGPKDTDGWPEPGVIIQGPAGRDAANPSFAIGTVTEGSVPKVTLTGTYPTMELDFELVKGEKGEDGADGQDGTDGIMASVVAADDSITVDSTDPANPEVAVQISADTGNGLELKADGLYVTASGESGTLTGVSAGTGITVDSVSNPAVPKISVSSSVLDSITDTDLLLWQGI